MVRSKKEEPQEVRLSFSMSLGYFLSQCGGGVEVKSDSASSLGSLSSLPCVPYLLKGKCVKDFSVHSEKW